MTATLPYIILAIFFGRAVTLKGSLDGIIHMFKPEVTTDVFFDKMLHLTSNFRTGFISKATESK